MSRYIDIEPYEKDGWYLQKHCHEEYYESVKTMPLITIPTAEPVVRCKDCTYATDPNEGYVYCPVNERCFKFNDFCSYGEQKERDHYRELTVEDYLK